MGEVYHSESECLRGVHDKIHLSFVSEMGSNEIHTSVPSYFLVPTGSKIP